jgi:hypothetical protein
MRTGQKYSTPDFYPWLIWWKKGCCSFEGVNRIIEARNEEIAPTVYRPTSDHLFSPFVAAGWSPDENFNKRPAQWLGLLKTLNMMGAEFFYSGYFVAVADQFRDTGQREAASPNGIPKNNHLLANFIWQTAIPSYAQATATRYHNTLINGKLLKGDAPSQNPVNFSYNFKANLSNCTNNFATDYMVVARKQNNNQNANDIYAITATTQPIEPPGGFQAINYIDNDADKSCNVSFNLKDADITGSPNFDLTIKARRQGSTYIYNRTDPNNIVFYQLDGWHQWEHPLYWNKNFLLESELYDGLKHPASSAPKSFFLPIVVHTTNVNNQPITNGDYTDYVTYLSAGVNAQPVYYFEPREANNEYKIFVKVRSINGNRIPVEANISGTMQQHTDVIYTDCGARWAWYEYHQTFRNNAAQEYALTHSFNKFLEIDKWYITQEGTLPADIQGYTPICH